MEVSAVPAHTHTHVHAHVHTCIHTRTHTRTHTDAYTHTCTRLYIHAYIHTYTHTQIQTVHTHVHTFMHTYAHRYRRIYTHAHVHTYTHTYAHTHTHTHTHTGNPLMNFMIPPTRQEERKVRRHGISLFFTVTSEKTPWYVGGKCLADDIFTALYAYTDNYIHNLLCFFHFACFSKIVFSLPASSSFQAGNEQTKKQINKGVNSFLATCKIFQNRSEV